MNTTAELTMYQEALRAEGTAILRWDLNADRVYGDELLQGVIPEKLKNESYSAFLLQSLPLHPNDRIFFVSLVEFLKKPHPEYADTTHEKVIEYRVKEDSGEYRWYHARYIIHFEKERAQYATILLRNTDSEHRHTEALQQKAQRDALTGLYNKEYAKELIKEALGVPGTVKALLVLDMDGFKKINDNLGHLFGDAVISDMALTLAEVFDETDIIGRVGGDEFVVLIRDAADRSLVVKRCEKLRNMLRRSFAYGDGKELHVSGSVGIAMSPEYGRRYEELFGFADAALYEAKRRGRDMQVFYTKDMQASQKKSAEDNTVMEKRQAFLTNPQVFIFQMLYETGDARITVETLLALFAKYFMVQRVVIYQQKRGQWVCWFEWHADGYSSAAEAHAGAAFEYINSHFQKEIYGIFSECPDTTLIDGEAGKTLVERSLCSFLHAGIMSEGKRIGFVGFDDCRGPRIWTKREHEVLKTFADVLGTFLMDQMRYEMVRKGYWHMQGVLNAMPLKIWVTSAKDGKVLYMNSKTRKALAGPENGEERTCYKVVTDSNRPCVRCKYFKLRGSCPVGLRLKHDAEEKNLTPVTVLWQGEGDSHLFVDRN